MQCHTLVAKHEEDDPCRHLLPELTDLTENFNDRYCELMEPVAFHTLAKVKTRILCEKQATATRTCRDRKRSQRKMIRMLGW